jgi:hypothetical protein
MGKPYSGPSTEIIADMGHKPKHNPLRLDIADSLDLLPELGSAGVDEALEV